MDKTAIENRKVFKATGKRRVDPMTRKYWEKFLSKKSLTDYDHPLLYRDDKYDYLIISLYKGQREEESILEEGFTPIPPMYSTMCNSYVKRFHNTRTGAIKEVGSEK